MQHLTEKQFEKAPKIVQSIYVLTLLNQPVPGSVMNEAMERYPDYFQEEIQYKKIWEAIPQSVKDAYFDELHKALAHSFPDNKGILYWINHQLEFQEYQKKYEEIRKQNEQIRKDIHKKHFEKYGL